LRKMLSELHEVMLHLHPKSIEWDKEEGAYKLSVDETN